jgi:hypothetical protein
MFSSATVIRLMPTIAIVVVDWQNVPTQLARFDFLKLVLWVEARANYAIKVLALLRQSLRQVTSLLQAEDVLLCNVLGLPKRVHDAKIELQIVVAGAIIMID